VLRLNGLMSPFSEGGKATGRHRDPALTMKTVTLPRAGDVMGYLVGIIGHGSGILCVPAPRLA
jgi:hypothetical protein